MDIELRAKYINFINNHPDIVAYRETKDLGGNTYYMASVKEKCADGRYIYRLHSVCHVFGEEFGLDIRGFVSYNTHRESVEAIERICGTKNKFVTMVKYPSKYLQ